MNADARYIMLMFLCFVVLDADDQWMIRFLHAKRKTCFHIVGAGSGEIHHSQGELVGYQQSIWLYAKRGKSTLHHWYGCLENLNPW